jgi:acetylornithine/N-succinyldiaminopimelate aminotransferase
VACAAAVAVLQLLLDDGFLGRVKKMGAYFTDKLRELNVPGMVEVRGMGLMLGMEISGDGAKVQKACQEQGLLINCIGGKTLRFLPPLIVVEEHIDAAIHVLEKAFSIIES